MTHVALSDRLLCTIRRLATAVGVVVLLAGCQQELFSRLNEQQANEVLAALAEARIDARKERVDQTHWLLTVDGDRAGEALIYLRDRGLPVQVSPTIGEIFKKDGMISTPTEERARFAWALQEGIAATLRLIDGVTEARVHVAMPNNDPLSDRPVPTSASVFLKYRQSLDAQALAPQIKSMVMASVEGLDYRNISLFAYPVDVGPNPARLRHAAAQPALPAETVSAVTATRALPAPTLMGSLSLIIGGISLSGAAIWWWDRRDRRSLPISRAKPAGPKDGNRSQAGMGNADVEDLTLRTPALAGLFTNSAASASAPPERFAGVIEADGGSTRTTQTDAESRAARGPAPPTAGALATLMIKPR